MQVPENFDPKIAKQCLILINALYSAAETKNSTLQLPDGYELIEELWAKPAGLFAHPELFGAILKHEESRVIYIAFRGTITGDDWLSDASCDQIDYPLDGKVLKGFWDIYSQIESLIQATVAKISKEGGYTTISTGHSLGAAIATFAIDDIFRPAYLYTFASPRVGDKKFTSPARPMDPIEHNFRIFNTEDIVPTGPLPVFGDIIYSHFGTPIAFTDNRGDIKLNHSCDTDGPYWDFIDLLILLRE